MTYAPADLLALQGYLSATTGAPKSQIGIVGSASHTKGYHLGRDRIYTIPPGLGDNDYSVRRARDKAALTNAASAIDFRFEPEGVPIGGSPGASALLRNLSGWLVAECRAGAPDTRWIRDIIYSLDGVTVWAWDRERGVASAPVQRIPADNHTTHTHISTYRDTRGVEKLGPFRRYLEEADMDPRTLVPLVLCDVAPGGTVYADPGRVKVLIPSWAGGTGVGLYADAAVPAATPPPLVPVRIDFGSGGSDIRLCWVGRDKVSNIRPVTDSTPYDQEDVDAAIAADRTLARVTWDA